MKDASVPDPANFSTTIDNPFMTLRAGTTFIYQNKPTGEVDTFAVTSETRTIDGVTCVAVHDTTRVNGIVLEDTIDWFAQDKAGNVWYFGENTRSYEPGNPDPVSTEGSWRAGVDGATPGIVMLAHPQIGDKYHQEHAPGVGEDRARVVSLDAPVSVTYGNFDGGLETREVNPLDPSVEHKFYVAGVGNVLTTSPGGDFEALTRIIVAGTSGADDLLGYAGGDHMRGRAGSDVVLALAGNDSIWGGHGDDQLHGGSGFDRLSGGAGDDQLTGGMGGDVFLFRGSHDGRIDTDTITDYHSAQIDVLDLVGGRSSVALDRFHDGAWELLLKDDADTIRLIGVSDSDGNGHILDNLLFA